MISEQALKERAKSLKQFEKQASGPAPGAGQFGQQHGVSLLLKELDKFADRKRAVEEATEKGRQQEREKMHQDKQEALDREAEHNRRISNPALCVVCGVDPSGSEGIVEAFGRKWHAGCWRCSVCQASLVDEKERYHNRFKLLCSTHYKALNFQCALCDKSIVGQESISFWGKRYHKTCYDSRGCSACNKPIDDTKEFLIAFESPFHIECFTCAKCKGIMKDEFILVGCTPWCVACNEKTIGPQHLHMKKDTTRTLHKVLLCSPNGADMVCGKCGKEVLTGVNALGQDWHESCFTCGICDRQLIGTEGFITVFDNVAKKQKAICRPCRNSPAFNSSYSLPPTSTSSTSLNGPPGSGSSGAVNETAGGAPPQCSSPDCEAPFGGTSFVKVMEKLYHPTCLKCHGCKAGLAGEQIFAIEGNPTCALCVRRHRMRTAE